MSEKIKSLVHIISALKKEGIRRAEYKSYFYNFFNKTIELDARMIPIFDENLIYEFLSDSLKLVNSSKNLIYYPGCLCCCNEWEVDLKKEIEKGKYCRVALIHRGSFASWGDTERYTRFLNYFKEKNIILLRFKIND